MCRSFQPSICTLILSSFLTGITMQPWLKGQPGCGLQWSHGQWTVPFRRAKQTFKSRITFAREPWNALVVTFSIVLLQSEKQSSQITNDTRDTTTRYVERLPCKWFRPSSISFFPYWILGFFSFQLVFWATLVTSRPIFTDFINSRLPRTTFRKKWSQSYVIAVCCCQQNLRLVIRAPFNRSMWVWKSILSMLSIGIQADDNHVATASICCSHVGLLRASYLWSRKMGMQLSHWAVLEPVKGFDTMIGGING